MKSTVENHSPIFSTRVPIYEIVYTCQIINPIKIQAHLRIPSADSARAREATRARTPRDRASFPSPKCAAGGPRRPLRSNGLHTICPFDGRRRAFSHTKRVKQGKRRADQPASMAWFFFHQFTRNVGLRGFQTKIVGEKQRSGWSEYIGY